MGYQQALKMAWNAIFPLKQGSDHVTLKLLSDTYTVDTKNNTIFSDSCNVPAKEYVSIILLHYLAKKISVKELPPLTGEWITFKELDGGEGYYPAFKKRTIDRILKKYGQDPDALKSAVGRMPADIADKGDVSIIIHPLEKIAIMIKMSKADEEFGPDANILFDKNISSILCTEDIVVLTEMVVHLI